MDCLTKALKRLIRIPLIILDNKSSCKYDCDSKIDSKEGVNFD